MGSCLTKRPSETTLKSLPSLASMASHSVTRPSICEHPSFVFSLPSHTETTSETSIQCSYEKMQEIYENYKRLTDDKTAEKLSPDIMKSVKTVMENLYKHLQMSDENSLRQHIFNGKHMENFHTHCINKSTNQLYGLIWIHYIYILMIYDEIWKNYPENMDECYDLMEQIALSHALKGVKIDELRNLHSNIYRYFTKKGSFSDFDIESTVIFMQWIENTIGRFMKNYGKISPNLENIDYFNTRARLNYRRLKRWWQTCEQIYEQYESLQFNEKFHFKDYQMIDEDEITLPTLILKERDWLMRHFCKTPKDRKLGEYVPDAFGQP